MAFLAILCLLIFSRTVLENIQQGGSVMSEKLNGSVCRKVRDVAILCLLSLPVAIMSVVFFVIVLVIVSVVSGTIVSVCWNASITKMFGVNEITWFKAFVLTFTIGCLRTDFKSDAKTEYEDIKEKVFSKIQSEKLSEVVSVILVTLLTLISIFVTIGVTMYSWNNILPQLLNVELIQINFWQAFSFAYLFHLFFGNTKSFNKKSNKKKENKNKEASQKEKDAESRETEDDTFGTSSFLKEY